MTTRAEQIRWLTDETIWLGIDTELPSGMRCMPEPPPENQPQIVEVRDEYRLRSQEAARHAAEVRSRWGVDGTPVPTADVS